MDDEADCIIVDPPRSAEQAGLTYVTDDEPGITRRRAGKGFVYRDTNGQRITDRQALDRLRRLAIPPAWTRVWISPDARGHLQATGRDARGRKQHRYHPDWHAARDEVKFNRMREFGRALPRIRERVDHDMRGKPLARRTVLATIVRLLETTLVRIGNEEYARQNDSFGLTTLRADHVRESGRELLLEFKGKSGKLHSVRVHDRRARRIIKATQDLPGQELFQYLDEEGERQKVTSRDVNEYLQEISGEPFTAKDFRTFAATVMAAWALQEFEQFDTRAKCKRNIRQAIEAVARRLGNTPAICRKSYVHPEVLNAYLDGSLLATLQDRAEEDLRDELGGLRPEEAAVLAFLQKRIALQTDEHPKEFEPTDPHGLADALAESLHRERAHAADDGCAPSPPSSAGAGRRDVASSLPESADRAAPRVA
jgi:DNA topoisomerase I